MKLSTMFHRAQKELTRPTGRPYVMDDDGHCALGVILHYKYCAVNGCKAFKTNKSSHVYDLNEKEIPNDSSWGAYLNE